MTDAGPTPPPTVAPLEYAPRQPWHRRRVWLILLGAVVVAVVVSVFAYRRYQPIVAEHFRIVSLHKTCLNYSIPPDKVVYRESQAMQSLRGAQSAPPDMVGMISDNSQLSWLSPLFLRNQTLTGESLATTPLVKRVDAYGVLFLHGRHAKGGAERLVCIEINRGRPYANIQHAPSAMPTWTFRAIVVRPASLISTTELLWEKEFVTIDGWSNPGFGLQVLGGQPDPADESHFTIVVPTLYPNRIIDGWLLPDDTVKLQVRPTDNKQQTTNPIS